MLEWLKNSEKIVENRLVAELDRIGFRGTIKGTAFLLSMWILR